jgi:2,3-bisphosphoglycerate-independent phosphoglycerate mutase
MYSAKSPFILVILDGYGIGKPSKNNAISTAKKPTIDRLFELYPHTLIGATGMDVGLEDNKMSGSESGHMNIGAGRIVTQDSNYISRSIKDGSFYMNPALIGAIKHVKKNTGSKMHVMGLMGDHDSPHCEPDHLRAILKLAKTNKITEVYCHLFTDGRDSYPKSALDHLRYFRQMMREEGIGKIASLSGRFYAMDRAKNWHRLTRAYDAIVFGKGVAATSAEEAIAQAYKNDLTDEYLVPTVIYEMGQPVATVKKKDSVVFYNLRSDRARQFTKLFVAKSKESMIKDNMPILDRLPDLYFVAMTDFGPDLDVHTVFPGCQVSSTLPMAMSHLKQLYIAESEKYAHVTYFLNGGYADPVNGEDRVMIPSPIIDSYSNIPEMSAPIITDHVVSNIQADKYEFYCINYANADMVGHTGDLPATVKAIECVDKQLRSLAKALAKRNGTLMICADHGNAENMFDEHSNQPNTFHTKNPVPLVIVNELLRRKKLQSGGVLGNIAPTILELLGIDKPKLMDKQSLA